MKERVVSINTHECIAKFKKNFMCAQSNAGLT